MRHRSGLVMLLTLSAGCAKATPDSQPPDDARLIDTAEYTAPAAAEVPETPAASEPRPESVLYRAELHRATGGGKAGYLLSQLGPEPHRPRGRWEGWRITSVFPADPALCAPGCDLYPGDVVLTVNGSPLERPEQLSALMAELPELEVLTVRLLRDGKLHEREYTIVD